MNTQKMKKVTVLVAAVLMIVGTNSFAQRGRNFDNRSDGFGRFEFCERIPDLTENQEAKIKDLRLDHLKEMNNYRNQMNELRAKERTLMTTDGTNMSEINAVIDQRTDVHNKMMKASAKHRRDVRSTLTDEQKVYFDAMPRHGRGNGRGHGKAGRGSRNFNGPGQGYGQGQGLGYGRGYGYNNLPSDNE
jgi:Spy/CpxP family protein refolding chaperone